MDAAGYRERREESSAPGRRGRGGGGAYGRPVALDAMTASERRIVHEYLRERGEVQTYSEGEEPDRHLVVAAAERRPAGGVRRDVSRFSPR